ncbi:hypothetical protein N7486_007910 [Penicillium sp. IBT 16267x]|nr:hypothetical protein N7486_007910 [Penicillium sp. IBT 16267x]
MLCQDLLDLLSRIEDSIGQADQGDSPQSCLPRVLTRDGVIVMETQEQDGGATNIDQWVTDLAEQCPSCAMSVNSMNGDSESQEMEG